MTDDDLLRIGTELHEDPAWDGGWMRGGRPVNNLEMLASSVVHRKQRSITRFEQGCCGLTPLCNGRCPDGGWCERTMFDERCGDWCKRLVGWLNEMETRNVNG